MAHLLTITTPYGERYKVHTNGCIQRTDQKSNPSLTWLLQGISTVKGRNFIPLESMVPENLASLDLLYKNQKPRYTVRDWDHGTTREWGNTDYHGIKTITWEGQPERETTGFKVYRMTDKSLTVVAKDENAYPRMRVLRDETIIKLLMRMSDSEFDGSCVFDLGIGGYQKDS